MPRSWATCIGAVVSVCCVRQDIDALVDHGLGSVGFLAGVEPGVNPDDLELEARIDRAGALFEGVDTHDDFRDREGGDVGGTVVLRHLGRDLAEDVAAFIETRVVGCEVRTALEARRVLELHLRELGGNLDSRVHEAERGGEDQRAAGTCKTLDGAFSIRAFRHVFEIRSLDLVAKFLLDLLAAEIMRLRVAAVRMRADIDEADLGRSRFGGGSETNDGGSCRCEGEC